MKINITQIRLIKSESDIIQLTSNANTNTLGILNIKMSSTEQLTRAPVQFYPLMSGGHAKIYFGTINGKDYIVKEGITKKDKNDIIKEKQVLNDLSECKHVVNIYTASDFESNVNIKIMDSNKINNMSLSNEGSLILEKINGFQLGCVFLMLEEALGYGIIDIENYFNALIFLFKDALDGLDEIQTKNYVHGDIKPNNILYDSERNHTSYIDFGTSVKEGESIKVGHEFFASPEVIKGIVGRDVKATFNSDLWAIGQIIYKCINSLLHNDSSAFLSDDISKNNSYSDRIANISNLITENDRYTNGTSNKISTIINVDDLPKSPIEHTIKNYEEFTSFHKNLDVVFRCLEGIFNKRLEQRLTVKKTISILSENYGINEYKATKLIADIACCGNLELKGEILRHSREKYQFSS